MNQVVTLAVNIAASSGNPWAIALAIVVNSMNAQAAKKKAADQQAAQQAAQRAAYNASLKDRLVNVMAADAPAVTVYGRAKVGGAIAAVFTSGARDEYKHIICIHAAHECDAFEEIYINGNALGALDGNGNLTNTSHKYYGKVRVKRHLGTAGDAADADLVSESGGKWTTTCTLTGLCYTYVRIDLNEPEFQSGLPRIEVLLRGKKLYDPRSGLTVWSQNNALVMMDYLTGEDCGVAYGDLPQDQFITAANVCDEVGVRVNPRYTFNGTITSDQDKPKMIEQIAASMSGGIVPLTWDVWAGKYTAPVMALTEADIVGDQSVAGGASDADLFNTVQGQFISSENLYVATDFKPYQNATYLAADGGEKKNNTDFPFTDSTQRCHNLVRMLMEDRRNDLTFTGQMSLKCWALKVGQRVTFTHSLYQWSSKVFRVISKRYQNGQPVTLVLKEDDATIWDEADAVVVDGTPNTGLQSPWVVAMPGNLRVSESKYQTTGSAGVKIRATAEWDAAPDALVTNYEFEYRRLGAATWIEIFDIRGTLLNMDDFIPGIYEFRVKSKNSWGAVSDYTAVLTKEIVGLMDVPADVTGFSVRVVSGQAQAVLDKHPALDVCIGGRIVIRWSPLSSGATWMSGCLLSPDGYPGDSSSFFVPLLGGTYMAKALDSSGNYSANAASFVLTEAHMTGFNTLATATEHPAFSGTKTSVALVDGGIQLVGAALWDDLGALDSLDMIDSLGGIVPSGSYAFSNRIDLGSVQTVRLFPNLKSLAFNTGDLWDSRTALIDDWGLVDGDVIEDADAALEVRATNDDPAGSPTWGAWHPLPGQADYTARAFEFRIALASADPTHNRRITELSVAAKQPL